MRVAGKAFRHHERVKTQPLFWKIDGTATAASLRIVLQLCSLVYYSQDCSLFWMQIKFFTSAPGISIQLHLSGLLATYRFAFNVAFFFFKWVTQSNLLSLTEKDALSFYIYSIICCLASIQTEQQRKTQHVSSIHNASSAVITQTSDFFLASRATINVQKSTYLTKKNSLDNSTMYCFLI